MLHPVHPGEVVDWDCTPCNDIHRSFLPPAYYGSSFDSGSVEVSVFDGSGNYFVFARCGHQTPCHCFSWFNVITQPLIIASDGGHRLGKHRDAFSGIGVYVGQGSPYNVSELIPPSTYTPNSGRAEITAALRAVHTVMRMRDGGLFMGVRTVILKLDSQAVEHAMTKCDFQTFRDSYVRTSFCKSDRDLYWELEEALVRLYNHYNMALLFWWVPRQYNKDADSLASTVLTKEEFKRKVAMAIAKAQLHNKRKRDEVEAEEESVAKRACAQDHSELPPQALSEAIQLSNLPPELQWALRRSSRIAAQKQPSARLAQAVAASASAPHIERSDLPPRRNLIPATQRPPVAQPARSRAVDLAAAMSQQPANVEHMPGLKLPSGPLQLSGNAALPQPQPVSIPLKSLRKQNASTRVPFVKVPWDVLTASSGVPNPSLSAMTASSLPNPEQPSIRQTGGGVPSTSPDFSLPQVLAGFAALRPVVPVDLVPKPVPPIVSAGLPQREPSNESQDTIELPPLPKTPPHLPVIPRRAAVL
jgi:ribonuclease HI